MSVKRNKIGFISILIAIVLVLTGSTSVFARNISNTDKNQKVASEILSDIDSYQEKYFTIIKRNDMLLQMENSKTLNKDRKDLDKLYKKVKKQITNKHYLKKYKDIKKRYAKCDDITDTGMRDFASKNYNEIDNLLNEIYKEVKSKILPEDFKNLAKSEAAWLREVNDYANTLSSMDYGTIGTLIYYDYQINMTEFRIFLLLLYL